MTEKTDVILIADGGDLTVGRHMPAYTYGAFDVTIPADKQQEQPAESRLRNGYIYRPPNAGAGAFDVGFVRADVTLNMNGKSSNLEAVVDAAQKRVDGNLFFERDITGRGLGAYEPGADFRLGDVVLVEIWGRRIKVPVTAIDLIGNSQEGARGWRVHVGGQMISDAEALKTHNSAIWERINQERAERLRTVGAVQKTATTAVTAAGVADVKAATADTKADNAAVAADDADRKAREADRKAIEALQTTITGVPRILHIDTGDINLFTGSSGKINSGTEWGTLRWLAAGIRPRSGARFEAKGNWVGSILMIAVSDQGATDVSCANITAGNRYHDSATGGLFQAYKSATVFILPSA
nr:MAG TPA: hypothetical protein [Caudoviricetes sp.]